MDRPLARTAAGLVAALLWTAACTGGDESAVGPSDERVGSPDGALVPIPAADHTVTTDSGTRDPGVAEGEHQPVMSAPPPGTEARAAVIDADGRLGLVDGGVTADTWTKFTAFPSPDRSTAVLTLGPDVEGIGPERPVKWVSLPDGELLGDQSMRSGAELTATSLDGTFAGFTTGADEPADGAIAGGRASSRIEIVSLDDGTVFLTELRGNFVPEAFGSRLTAEGVPAHVFLLEYVPADAPRFYRVRVLSTETGEVSLPLNLRNKQEQVDERMAGFTRSQVVAHDHGLLFTLYRGTIDGTPDGEPYAFVHTLDFADGVWCLDVDPALELDRVAGSLAVGGDRLYVGSANGRVGSFPIPSITNPDLSPTMDWVVEIGRATPQAPVMLGDPDGVWIGTDDDVSRLIRLDVTGRRLAPTGLPSSGPTALAATPSALHAVGDDWATFDLTRPGWLDDIEVLVVR